MTAGVRVAAFGALLVAVFALAALAGRAADPADPAAPAAGPGGHGPAAAPAHPAAAATHGHTAAPAAPATTLRIVATGTTLTPGRPARFSFRIAGAGGATLRAFETEQGRRMHLIVVRRDLRRFQHLHPVQDARGRWTVALTLPDAGVYHAFADFQTGGARRTLGVDLFAGGRFEPLALPAASTTARTDGYAVTLANAGSGGGELRFAVRRGATTVSDLQPYLGANGHLVMLRAGDLAYEHVHPLQTSGALAFDTAGVAPGTYRLFLQFRHRDRVHTAAFTHEVAG
jgi:hypothetical protein